MSFYPGPAEFEQGTIVPGVMTRERRYNLHPDPSLTGPPTYTTMTETWEGMDTPPAVTHYNVQPNTTPRSTEITYPDGTRSVELLYNHPDQFDDGLPYQKSIYDATGQLLQRTNTQWRPGELNNSPLVSRIEKTDVHGQVRATEFNYYLVFESGGIGDSLKEILEFDYFLEGTQTTRNALRRTILTYEMDPAYGPRHILNLPGTVSIYEHIGDEWLIKSFVEYRYDGQPLKSLPTLQALGHDGRFNPDVPVLYDKAASDYRGNITEVKKYADAGNHSGPVTETYRYDITGNVVEASTLQCEQRGSEYSAAMQYAYQTADTCGSADPSSPVRTKTTAVYDFGTGVPLFATDANGSTVSIGYYPKSLRPREVYWLGEPGLEHRLYSYDDANLATQEVTLNSYASDVVSQVVRRFNGLGLARREERLGDGDTWNFVETQYDALGRLWKQTLPFRAGEQVHWSERSYDGLGRLTMLRAPKLERVPDLL